MTSWRRLAIILAGCVLSNGTAQAADDAKLAAMEQEIKALRSEVTQLRAANGDTWLNERRTEEVKALIKEVLSDADTRASMQGAGVTAGWNKGFFISSEDGNFLLRLAGRIQFRYIAALADEAGNTGSSTSRDETENGFTMRRTKLEWYGHIYDPKLQYKIVGAFDRGDGDLVLEESYLTYWFADQHYVQAGGYKGPFLREELVSSKRQLTVERSHIAEMFTLDYNQNAEIGGEYESWRWRLSLHDGREGDNIDYNVDNTDFAIAGRVEYRLAGDWKQFEDFTVWTTDPIGLMIAVAFDYENGEGGGGSNVPSGDPAVNWNHMLQYTADVSLEMQPFTLFGAFVGRYLQHDQGVAGFAANQDERHQWGWLVQGSVFLVPDKLELYARYEYLDFDNTAEVSAEAGKNSVAAIGSLPGDRVDATQEIITVGGNYYFHKHDMKATFDVQWAPRGIRAGESAEGTVTSNMGESDQITLRAQLQLLF